MKFEKLPKISLVIFCFGVEFLFFSTGLAQNSKIYSAPTWTQQQWDDAAADKDAMLKEQELEFEVQVRDGKFTPVPQPKEFKGTIKLSAPTSLKISVNEGKVYLSWDKVEAAKGYIVSESKDGKVYKQMGNSVVTTKIFIGFYKKVKNQRACYYGVQSHYYAETSKMIVLLVGPENIETK